MVLGSFQSGKVVLYIWCYKLNQVSASYTCYGITLVWKLELLYIDECL